MYLYSTLSRLHSSILTVLLILTTTISGQEPTQKKREEMAVKLIPTITSLIMDDRPKIVTLVRKTGQTHIYKDKMMDITKQVSLFLILEMILQR